jgi:hypothetical protein
MTILLRQNEVIQVEGWFKMAEGSVQDARWGQRQKSTGRRDDPTLQEP